MVLQLMKARLLNSRPSNVLGTMNEHSLASCLPFAPSVRTLSSSLASRGIQASTEA